jgi:eukaryotic-like serine/threonine-protein kinase
VPETEYRYWAFISYSHADEKWASWLHRSLERYRIPARLRGRPARFGPIPAKLFPVFRDRDELAGSSALGPELQRALESSRTLVVVCSPRSAASRWVNEEIRHFKKIGRADRVFALIVDGEPHALARGEPEEECFPEALRYAVNDRGEVIGDDLVEPIAADVRRHGDGRANARLKLIAGILGVGFDDLRQREMQARNRRLGFIAALASGIAALTIVLAIQAHYARNDAQRRQRQAEDLIEFMLGDLRGKLEPIGKLEILDAVGDKAMSYFATLPETDVTDTVLQSRATALRQIGHVRSMRGDLAGAADAYEQALKLDLALIERHPDDAQSLYHVARSQFGVGYAHYLKGEIEQAMPWFEKHAASAQRLVALEPGNDAWAAELGEAQVNLGTLALRRGELERARAHYEAARASKQALVDRVPDKAEFLQQLAYVHGWLNHVDTLRLDHAAALAQARAQTGLLRRLVALAPDNAGYRLELAVALQQQVYSEASLSAVPPDAPALAEALRLTEALARHDPANVEYQRAHAVSLSYVEDANLVAGHRAAARAANEVGLAQARALLQRAPESSEAMDDLLLVMKRSVKLAWYLGERERARELLDQALALTRSGAHATPDPARRLELHVLGQWLAADAVERAAHAAAAAEVLARLDGGKARPEVLMRHHALNGDAQAAAREAARLTAVERGHPYVLQFCRDHPCGLSAAPTVTARSGAG